MQTIYGEDAIQIPSNKALDSYMPFVEKFKQLLKQKSNLRACLNFVRKELSQK